MILIFAVLFLKFVFFNIVRLESIYFSDELEQDIADTRNRCAAERRPESPAHLTWFELKPLAHYLTALHIALPEHPGVER